MKGIKFINLKTRTCNTIKIKGKLRKFLIADDLESYLQKTFTIISALPTIFDTDKALLKMHTKTFPLEKN